MENDDRLSWMPRDVEADFWGPDCGCCSGEEHEERCERPATAQLDGET
jgi:hypothetical protein